MNSDEELTRRAQEAEKRYSLLAENLVDAIWVLDVSTMSYIYVSPSVEALRGFTVAEVMAKTFTEFLTPASAQKTAGILEEEIALFKKGERRKRFIELEMYHKEGHTIWVEIISRLTQASDGSFRIIGVTRNIDKLKRYEMERDDLIQNMERALAEEKRLRRENRVLRGLLPICAACKKIRDDEGVWHDLETFIEERSEAEFTHTICPQCKDRLYPELKTPTE